MYNYGNNNNNNVEHMYMYMYVYEYVYRLERRVKERGVAPQRKDVPILRIRQFLFTTGTLLESK